jgi:PBP1b-binding outer membrane lipoprotein LpoB
MKKQRIYFTILLAAILLLTISCSNSEDPNEKGTLKETQDKIAQDAVNNIKVPLDKAKNASKLANEKTRQIKEVQQQ